MGGAKVIGMDTETISGGDGVHIPLTIQLYSEDVDLASRFKGFPNVGVVDRYGVIIYAYPRGGEVLRELFRKSCRGSYIFTFNLAFDITVISKALPTEGFKVKVFEAGGRAVMATVSFSKSSIKVYDLRNIYMARSLDRLGKLVGVEKMAKPELLGRRELLDLIRSDERAREEFEAYAVNDARVCYHAGRYLIEEFGRVKATVGSLSVYNYFKSTAPRRRAGGEYLDTPLSFPTYPDSVKAKFKAAYRGGRVEVFKRGSNDKVVKYYDVNSLYPYVMATNRFPLVNMNKLGRFVEKSSINLDYEGVAKVRAYIDSDIPPLGVKRVCEDGYERLVFPKGYVVDYFTYPELRYVEGRGLGRVDKVFEAFEFRVWWHPFRDYMLDLYSKRKEVKGSNEVLANFYKLLMNSLYGKFGEWREGEWVELIKGTPVKSEVNEQRVRDRYYQNFVWAAYITAYARLKLHEYMSRLPSDSIYYCDTDSIITSGSLDNYVGGDLGMLKLEGEARTYRATFIRSKFYLFEDAVRLKGFYSVHNADMVRVLLMMGRYEIPQRMILKYREASRRGLPPLIELVVRKKFTPEPDHKRYYLRHLRSRELLEALTDSRPKTYNEGAL